MKNLIQIKNMLLNTNMFYPNQYLDKYCSLVVEEETDKVLYKTQTHHILPRSYFLHLGLPVDNTQTNLVILSHRNHVLAHIYLALCAKTDYLVGANKRAVILALCTPHDLTDQQFEELQNDFERLDAYQELMEISLHFSDEHRAKISESLRGKNVGIVRTEDFKQKLRDYYKEHPKVGPIFSEEQKLQIAQSVSNYWASLDAESKYVRNKKISDKLRGVPKPAGFAEHMSLTRRGKNNPCYGRVYTEEERRRASERMLLNNPFRGKHHTEESKRRAVSTRKANGSYRSRIWINNGVENKFIYPEEFELYEKLGYIRGKLPHKKHDKDKK